MAKPTGERFDHWIDSYAKRAGSLSVSEVRALFAVVSRPEVVSLAGGMPNVSSLPKELITESFEKLMSTKGDMALQYGGGQGDVTLRGQIHDIMALEGIQSSVEDLVITTGSQHGLELLAGLFLDEGDVVIAEGPSYVGALGTFRQYEASVVHVEMDMSGLVPDSLRAAIKSVRAGPLPLYGTCTSLILAVVFSSSKPKWPSVPAPDEA
jgi:DNA-binding transcriptional MocR family regulator